MSVTRGSCGSGSQRGPTSCPSWPSSSGGRSALWGISPSDQAALKCLYLTLQSLDPTGHGRQRWALRWTPALNAFALMFEGRVIPNVGRRLDVRVGAEHIDVLDGATVVAKTRGRRKSA